MRGFRRHGLDGLRQIAFLLIPAAVVSAVLAEPIMRILFQRGQLHAAADAGRRSCARRVQRGPRLQRRDADAQPCVLQPAVELDPDLVALGNLVLNVILDLVLLPFRNVGDPARDRDLQRRRQRSPCSSCCAGGSGGSTAAAIAIVGRRRSSSPRRSSRVSRTGVWRPLDSAARPVVPGPAALARRRARRVARRLLRRLPRAAGARVAGATLAARAHRAAL